MSAIRVLDQELINQIAAGEVIERPSSVVKELLENAIDAHAANILVEIEGSGIDLIRLADDGHGMSREDLDVAILRHATSKIARSDDLFSIRTLGFRGEALPSILSVSRSMIASRTEPSSNGWYLSLEAGSVKEKGMKGMPPGTIIEVKDLFFNTPARRKFLKAAATEQRHIIDVVSRYSLAYPSVRFTLSANGRSVLNLREGSSLEERVTGAWGKEVQGKLHAFSDDRPQLRIHGIIASPEATRPTRSGIYTYVNRRSVLDHTLRSAVLEGFSGLIMKQRFPLAVLFIDIDTSEVDVNVHPAKAEVRFRNPSAVFGAIVNTVRQTLNGHPSSSWQVPEGKPAVFPVEEPGASYRLKPQTVYQAPKYPFLQTFQPGLIQKNLFGDKKTGHTYSDKSIVGVFQSTYILLEDETSLYILDQHAAHERVTYERMKNAGSSAQPPIQALLSPHIIELSPVEFAAFGEIAQDIRTLGIEAEPFGDTAVAVRSIPSVLSRGNIQAIVMDLINAVMEGELRRKEYLNELLIRIACHSSIRAGKRLHHAEIEGLLKDLDEVGSPLTCPHGRPLFKRIGADEIERWIGRRPLS